MIKSCLVLMNNEMMAEYFNMIKKDNKKIIKKIYKYINSFKNVNQLTNFTIDNQEKSKKYYYFNFQFLKKKFILIYEIGNLKYEKITYLEDISKKLKNYIINNFEIKIYEGTLNFSITLYLNNLICQYEKEINKSFKINTLEDSLMDLKNQTNKSFVDIIYRGKDLNEISNEILMMDVESKNLLKTSYKLKRVSIYKKYKKIIFLSILFLLIIIVCVIKILI